ncbi:hypothetical protein Gotur_001990 [Gossypium turneri]
MLKYDDSSSSSNSENTELFKKQYDEEKTSTDQDEDIKVSTYKSDEEKTSTDQDEDIKVSTYNSDEETTSSDDETIDISEPMDTDSTNPYGKRKIEPDNQTDDYLRSLNKNFEIDKDIRKKKLAVTQSLKIQEED